MVKQDYSKTLIGCLIRGVSLAYDIKGIITKRNKFEVFLGRYGKYNIQHKLVIWIKRCKYFGKQMLSLSTLLKHRKTQQRRVPISDRLIDTCKWLKSRGVLLSLYATIPASTFTFV